MNGWTEMGLKAALDDSDKLLVAAHDLNLALGAGKVAMLPNDVLTELRQMTHIIERIQHTVIMTKVQAFRGQG